MLKKGLSVSIKILSIGIDLNVSCKSNEFLKVIMPLAEKNEPSFIDFTASKIAEIKNLSKEDLVKKTTDNFNKLFFN